MPSLNNCVHLTYGHRKSLIKINYSESRESVNSLNALNYNDTLELSNLLILPKTCNAGTMMVFLYHEENQHIADLQDKTSNPDLAYFANQQVNRLSMGEQDSQPSLRGEPPISESQRKSLAKLLKRCTNPMLSLAALGFTNQETCLINCKKSLFVQNVDINQKTK